MIEMVSAMLLSLGPAFDAVVDSVVVLIVSGQALGRCAERM